MRACTVRKNRKRTRDQRGAALIMVLLAIVVLTVFLTDVQQDASTSFSSAISARERLKAEYHARSAINLSRLLIAVEPTVRTSVMTSPMGMMVAAMSGGKLPQLPVWTFADQLLGGFNGKDGAESFASLASVDMSTSEKLGLQGGNFEVVIIDEDSKININQAAQTNVLAADNVGMQLMGLMTGTQYDTFFERIGEDGQPADRRTICSAIIDWADPNQDRAPCDFSGQNVQAGVEDNYYQNVGLDYFRKNAGYDSLEELRLVQGVTEDFWATFIDPDSRDPRKRLVTVWGGDAKINVNSAEPRVLYGMICGPNGAPDEAICTDPAAAIQFLSALGMVRAFTQGAPLFGSAQDFIAFFQGKGMGGMVLPMLGMEPLTFKNPKLIVDMLTTKSKVFSIYAEGVVSDERGHRETRVSIHAVVDFRNATDPTKPPEEEPQPSGQLDAEAIANALVVNPAGNVIHYKIR